MNQTIEQTERPDRGSEGFVVVVDAFRCDLVVRSAPVSTMVLT
jgi:hypothetical protein